MSDIKCDTDEILKRLSVLDSLKQLRDNMGNDFFTQTFPELTGLDKKLDILIDKQESELQDKMSNCGAIEADELPTDIIAEPSVLLEPEPDSGLEADPEL